MGNQPAPIFATSAGAERERVASLPFRIRSIREIFPRDTDFSHVVAIGQIQEEGYVSVQMMLSRSGETYLELRRTHFQEFCEWFMTIRDSLAEMTQSEFAEYISRKIHTLNMALGERKRVTIPLTLLSAV